MAKKGDFVSDNFLELILGAFVFLIIIFLLFSIIGPVKNAEEDKARAYFKVLEKAVNAADNGETGDIFVWLGNIWIVYFGEGDGYQHEAETQTEYYLGSVKTGEKTIITTFTRGVPIKDAMCICYLESEDLKGDRDEIAYPQKGKCFQCISLKNVVLDIETADKTDFNIVRANKTGDITINFLQKKVYVSGASNNKFAIRPNVNAYISKQGDKYVFSLNP